MTRKQAWAWIAVFVAAAAIGGYWIPTWDRWAETPPGDQLMASALMSVIVTAIWPLLWWAIRGFRLDRASKPLQAWGGVTAVWLFWQAAQTGVMYPVFYS